MQNFEHKKLIEKITKLDEVPSEQKDFSDFRRQNKVTRREKFLEEMERVMPWKRLEARIAPAYPVAGNGRRP